MIISLELPTRVDLMGPLCTTGADEPVYPHHARHLVRDLAAQVLDQNLRFLSRASGLIDVALGQGIDRLVKTGGLLKLGYQRLGDYTLQRLGMSGRRGQELSWMERKLADFPLMDRARRAGELLFSHVRMLLRYIEPADEEEWVERARHLTVRRLEDALVERFGNKKKPAPPGDDEESSDTDDTGEPGRWIEARMPPFALLKWDMALDIVRKMMGLDLSVAEAVDLMLPEFMFGVGANLARLPKARWWKPREKEPPHPGDPGTPEHLERCRELQRFLEDETRKWYFLPWDAPDVEIAEFVQVPDDMVDPWDLDLRLRLIRRLAQRVDTYLARLLWALSNHKLWKDMKFTSFGHYVVERLGMSRRNAQALVALRRKFFDLPKVAAAFLAGEITRSQAEVINRVADDTYEHEWIDYAKKVSLLHLKGLVKQRLIIKQRKPGEFWDTCRRPPLLPDVGVQMCAPAEGSPADDEPGLAGSPEPSADAQTCAPPEGSPADDEPGLAGSPEPSADAQTCAPAEGGLVDDGSRQGSAGCPARPSNAQTCAPAEGGPADASQGSERSTEKPTGEQACEPAEDCSADAGQGQERDGASEQPTTTQTREPATPPVSKRQAAAQEKAELEKMMLELIGSSQRIPVRFFLPQDMEEAWGAFTWLCDMASDGKAKIADYLECLADALLMEHGEAAAQQMKDHPTQSRDRWHCVIPTCSALQCFHEHHVRRRSQGGSNDPSNLANTCMGHHQAGIHAGHIHVTGHAPDHLVIQQGVSPDGRVHLTFVDGVLLPDSYAEA